MATQAFGPGIRALSIYDTTDGTTVQIDGADISPESTITRTSVTRTSAKGGVSALNKQWELNVQFADASAFASLDAEDSQTRKWQVVAAGLNGKNLQWYEDSTFVLEESVSTDPTSDSNFPYRLTVKHISESPEIYTNVNLLAYLGWADADANNVADGYNISALVLSTGTVDFTDPVQQLNCTDPSTGSPYNFSVEIIFPISDILITSSVFFVAGDDISRFSLKNLNFADSAINDKVDNPSAGISSIGLKSFAGTYKFRFIPINSDQNQTPGIRSIQYPALTTNGTLTPGTEFLGY